MIPIKTCIMPKKFPNWKELKTPPKKQIVRLESLLDPKFKCIGKNLIIDGTTVTIVEKIPREHIIVVNKKEVFKITERGKKEIQIKDKKYCKYYSYSRPTLGVLEYANN